MIYFLRIAFCTYHLQPSAAPIHARNQDPDPSRTSTMVLVIAAFVFHVGESCLACCSTSISVKKRSNPRNALLGDHLRCLPSH
ncbi:hypothetical protein BDW66DRAFT_140788 [Aspergillus desertorum]